jgi:hypothetical protein
MVPILFILTLLLLFSILIWAFNSLFQLVRVEIRNFPDEWDKDGQPFGAYLNRAGTHSYFRSGIASNWKMLQWMVKTPRWTHHNKLAAALLWQYRALVLIWNVGFILWAAIFLFSVIAP